MKGGKGWGGCVEVLSMAAVVPQEFPGVLTGGMHVYVCVHVMPQLPSCRFQWCRL